MQILASMTWGQWLVAMLIIVSCSFLILVILLQRGRGGGLAGAFGGAGGSSAFGAKTGDVFTWITVVVATGVVVVCVVANFMFEPPTEPQAVAAVPDTTVPSTTLPDLDTTLPTITPTDTVQETGGSGETDTPEPTTKTDTGGSDDSADGSGDQSSP